MANLVAVQPALHQHLLVVPSQIDTHAAGQNLIPLIPAELSHVATQLPVVLAKNGQTGQFVLAALTGFAVQENLMLEQGHWQGIYLPLQIQRQPFFVGKATPDAADYVVCIDLDSPATLFSTERLGAQRLPADAEALFNADGSETAYYRDAKLKLAQLLQGEQQRELLLSELLALRLLQPMSLEITFADQSITKLNGLYTIDEQQLAQLPAEHLVRLHQQGLLGAVYAILGSAAQIYGLIARKNKQLGY
ncbi:MAG: SapC family protein [Gammaproteobacteria bacterium]|jgi:hypothetical protein|nr:SapC family protein [Gammaproteobacteria bacterium]